MLAEAVAEIFKAGCMCNLRVSSVALSALQWSTEKCLLDEIAIQPAILLHLELLPLLLTEEIGERLVSTLSAVYS
jgi:hypothetical protein